jgi:hypothetical protein
MHREEAQRAFGIRIAVPNFPRQTDPSRRLDEKTRKARPPHELSAEQQHSPPVYRSGLFVGSRLSLSRPPARKLPRTREQHEEGNGAPLRPMAHFPRLRGWPWFADPVENR